MKINADDVRRMFLYDPFEGVMICRASGEDIGPIVRIGTEIYSSVRLAWIYMTGSEPNGRLTAERGLRWNGIKEDLDPVKVA